MRLHVLGDLHLEFGSVDIPPMDSDVVVLSGDVHLGANGLEWIKARFPTTPVIYVLGNHEFYRHALPTLTEQLIREAEGSQISLLENRAAELGGFVFLGCTLWTDFALRSNMQRDMAKAEGFLNDYRLIRCGTTNRVLRAQDTIQLHKESVGWLKTELARHDPARTIVVTHHAPSPRSDAPGYAKGTLSPAFVSDLGSLVEQSGIPLWVHGHTHYNVDYQLGATRVLTNQRGYPREACAGFDPGMVIEL